MLFVVLEHIPLVTNRKWWGATEYLFSYPDRSRFKMRTTIDSTHQHDVVGYFILILQG